MNSKIKNLPSLAFTGGYAVNLKAFNSRYKPHNTLYGRIYGGFAILKQNCEPKK
jgi:hypothetical protein